MGVGLCPYLGALVRSVLARVRDHTSSEQQTEGEQGQIAALIGLSVPAPLQPPEELVISAFSVPSTVPVGAVTSPGVTMLPATHTPFALQIVPSALATVLRTRRLRGLAEASWYTGCLRALPVIATDLISAA